MQKLTVVKELRTTLAALPSVIDGYVSTLAEIHKNMQALKRAGLIYAGQHWRAGKYFYLIYPDKGAGRVREYIGIDAKKIAAAKAGVERAEKYDQLALQSRNLERRLCEGRRVLNDALACLSGKYSW